MKPLNPFSISLKLIVTCLVLGVGLNSLAQDWNEIIKTTASDRASGDEFGSAVSISGNYAIVGVWRESEDVLGLDSMNQSGSAYIFEINESGDWIEVQKIVASDRFEDDRFGSAVTISGEIAIIGAFWEDEDSEGLNTVDKAGSAYIFERNDAGVWNEVQKIVASDRTAADWFGYTVSLSGDYAIIGAVFDTQDASGLNPLNTAGSAYVFERNEAGSWIEAQKIVPSDRATGDRFGLSVAISEGHALVSSYFEDEDVEGLNTMSRAGSAYVFERNDDGEWNEVQKIVASDRAIDDRFGWSVSISGDYAIIGVFEESEDADGNNTLNEAGSAYIFERNELGVWSEVQKIVASDRASGDVFGRAVSISGDYAIIGAHFEDDDPEGANTLSAAGSAYMFERNEAGAWNEIEKFVASDREIYDQFGFAVAISGNRAIVGAHFEDDDPEGANTLEGAGSAYIFKTGCQLIDGMANDTLCFQDTLYINGTAYHFANPTGTELFNNVGPNGCDSTVTIDLTVLNSLESEINQTICYGDSIVVNGTTYNSSVSGAIEVFSNIGPNNCDSTVTINLLVLSAIDTSTSVSGLVLTANQAGAEYQWIDCNNNNNPIAGATSAIYTASSNGSYAVQITMGDCSVTSACVSITSVGISEHNFGNDILLSPNPTKGNFSIDLGKIYPEVRVVITDLAGRQIQSNSFGESKMLNLSLEEPAGIYLVMIASGNKKALIRLVLE